jgi:hypothetical protein
MSIMQAGRVCLLFAVLLAAANVFGQTEGGGTAHGKPGELWRFAVSGDSRNCGDVVMPAIAQGALKDGAEFYWHLGDYRAIYEFDEDYQSRNPGVNIINYENVAWGDFIESQLKPFGPLPVYLALGNHENIPPKSQMQALIEFSDWFAKPEIVKQRLCDDASDHGLRAYYHWFHGGVDFITLDNSTPDQFDSAQMDWFAKQVTRDLSNTDVKSVVVGMHEALPDSLSAGHSMNDSAQGTVSGRNVYQQLLELQKKKKVYVLASHAHFYMDNVYNTKCRRDRKEEVLPGWIVGTAGAAWYELPKDVSGSTQQFAHIYGYLLGTVSPDGTIQFAFKQLSEDDAKAATKGYSDALFDKCFMNNSSNYTPPGPT